MIGKVVHITEGIAVRMIGNGVRGPDPVTIWRLPAPRPSLQRPHHGQVRQQTDGGNNDISVQEATGQDVPGGESQAYDDRDDYKDNRV